VALDLVDGQVDDVGEIRWELVKVARGQIDRKSLDAGGFGSGAPAATCRMTPASGGRKRAMPQTSLSLAR
jgi:hypothetical protein